MVLLRHMVVDAKTGETTVNTIDDPQWIDKPAGVVEKQIDSRKLKAELAKIGISADKIEVD